MDAVNVWDVALLAVAGYIAVTSLVRLMIARRNTLAAELRHEFEQEKLRQARLEKQKQQTAAIKGAGATKAPAVGKGGAVGKGPAANTAAPGGRPAA